MSSRGGASPVSALKQSAASCHWSLAAVGAHDVAPLGRQGHAASRRARARRGRSASGTAHCQPRSQSRPIGVVHAVSTEIAPCTRAGIVQVGERGAELAHDAQHGGHVVGAGAREPRADRLAGDPAPQIAGPAPALLVRRPVVVRRRRGGMVPVREPARLRLEPLACARDRARSRARASGRARRRSPGSADAGPTRPSAPQLQPGGSCQSARCSGSACVTRCTSPEARSGRGVPGSCAGRRGGAGHPRNLASGAGRGSARAVTIVTRRAPLRRPARARAAARRRAARSPRPCARAAAVPSSGAADCSDGTCTVTATTRHIVLGRIMLPSASTVSSCSTSPRAGITAL